MVSVQRTVWKHSDFVHKRSVKIRKTFLDVSLKSRESASKTARLDEFALSESCNRKHDDNVCNTLQTLGKCSRTCHSRLLRVMYILGEHEWKLSMREKFHLESQE